MSNFTSDVESGIEGGDQGEKDPGGGGDDEKLTFPSNVAGKPDRKKKYQRISPSDLELSDLSGPVASSSKVVRLSHNYNLDQSDKVYATKTKESSERKDKNSDIPLKSLAVAGSDITPTSPEVVIQIENDCGPSLSGHHDDATPTSRKSLSQAQKPLIKRTKSEPLLSVPDAVKKAMVNSKGNVRQRSGVAGKANGIEKVKVKSPPKKTPTKKRCKCEAKKKRRQRKKIQMSDKATQVGEDNEEKERPIEKQRIEPPQRRHSTGNITASHVNHIRLLAKFRRLQRRRLRPPNESVVVKYIQYFLSFLYYSGMSPLKPKSAQDLPKWFQRLQSGFYWTFAVISIIQCLDEVKWGWLQFRINDNMMTFITFGFFAANLVTRIYNIILFATSSTSTSNLLTKLEKVNSRGSRRKKSGWQRTVAVAVGSLSMLLTATSTIFGNVPFNNWSFRRVILSRSFEFSQSVFIWTSTNYTDQRLDLLDEYGQNVTVTVEWFAAAATFLCYCGTLHGCVILDLWPIITLQIFFLQSNFSKVFFETKARNRTKRCPLSIHWKHYMELREACDENHKVFGKLLKLIHMQNVLLYGYFLLQLLNHKGIHADFLINLFSVAKVSLTYYLVQKSADDNEKYEECVIQCSKCATTIEMDGVQMNVGILLKAMKKHPIGVGRGDFFVNEAFVLKLGCTVGSIFFLLSGENEKNAS